MDLLEDASMTMEDIHDAANNELVRENLQRILARNAVLRGVRWIEEHADNNGWWRNCLNTGRSRVRNDYTSEGILALVFEYQPLFVDNTGYINEGNISRYFGLTSREMEMHGFFCFGDWRPFPKKYPDVVITNKEINRAWAFFLENPPGDWCLPARYSIKEHAGWGAYSFPDEKPSFIRRFLNWLG